MIVQKTPQILETANCKLPGIEVNKKTSWANTNCSNDKVFIYVDFCGNYLTTFNLIITALTAGTGLPKTPDFNHEFQI